MGSEARTRLGIWFTLLVPLLAFNQVFDTPDYPGPAILGILLATGIAVAGRRLGLGTIVTSLLSFVSLSWYLSLVFAARDTLWTLPTPAALSRLVRAVSHAMEQSRVDFAPVPLRPGYTILIVAGIWLAATIGEVATFRWRRPLLASVLPLVLVSVSLVVGNGDGAGFYVLLFLVALLSYWGLESSHRLRSWGRWVTAWKHHTQEEEPRALTGELGRRLGAACVLGAFVAPLFLPALGDGLLSWRSGLGGGDGDGPGSGGGSLNPWVSIKPSLVEQSTQELFTVESSEGEYWRIATLETFDGVVWHEVRSDEVPAEGGAIAAESGVSLTGGRQVVQDITIQNLTGTSLPAAIAPQNVVRTDDGTSTEGISYDPDSGAIRVDEELERDDSYRITSVVPAVRFEDLRDAAVGNPGAQYLQLPEISGRVAQVLDGWTRGTTTPLQKLVAIQERLRDFRYTLEPDLPEDDDYLAQFLTSSREGYCQQFATAFAVMARMLDYPARVSVGFLPGSAPAGTTSFTVAGTDAHAWPEVFFQGYGWVPFEPTPRGFTEEVPQYANPEAEGGPGPGFLGDAASAGGAGALGGRGGSAFDDEAGGNTDAFRGGGLDDLGGRGEGVQARRRGPAEWQRTFGTLLTWLVVAALLFLALVPGLKEWRTRRRYQKATDPDATAAAAFAQFQEEAAELAQARAPSESALAYARRMAALERVVERSAVRLASIYEAAAYAEADITPQQAGEAKRLARRLRSQLWHKASWWNRAIRLFSPARLRPSGGGTGA